MSEGCRFDHNDPLRVEHRCNPTCGMTLQECVEVMRSQPISVPGYYVNNVAGQRIGLRVGDYVPARSFVTKLVGGGHA